LTNGDVVLQAQRLAPLAVQRRRERGYDILAPLSAPLMLVDRRRLVFFPVHSVEPQGTLHAQSFPLKSIRLPIREPGKLKLGVNLLESTQ
jgi:hypothetical protein